MGLSLPHHRGPVMQAWADHCGGESADNVVAYVDRALIDSEAIVLRDDGWSERAPRVTVTE
jgi:hypothetical protein